MRSRAGYLLWTLLAISSLIATLTLIESRSWTCDLSQGARFTLPSELLKPLDRLSDPLMIRAYLPLSAPPPYREVARHTKDLLSALPLAHPQISLTVIDSAQEQSSDHLSTLTKLAERDGVSTAQLAVERVGRRALLTVPYGVSFARLNQRVVTPPVERLEEIEYQIARATKRLMEQRPPQRIGLAQGSGEPDLLNSPLAKRLEAEGTLIPVRLDGESLEDELDVLVLLGATKSYGERARWVIDRLLCDGGSVIIALDHRQQSELFTDVWSARPTGLEPLLRRYGVSISNQWVIADPLNPAPAPLSRDARGQVTSAPHPLYPLGISTDHPVSAALSEVVIPMAPLFKLPPQAEVLVMSRPQSLALKSLRGLEISKAEEVITTPKGFPLAFVIELRLETCLPRPKKTLSPLQRQGLMGGSISAMEEAKEEVRSAPPLARLVVIGSGRRLLSADPKGLELLMNSIAWGRRDGALLKLKSRRVERPRLSLSSLEQRLLQWGSVVIPMLVILLITLLVRKPRRVRVRK